jgi:transcriptional regulator with XRE-family HTH domain
MKKRNRVNPPNSHDCYDKTLEEVAQIMGLTRQRVWQLERGALETIAQTVIDDLKLPTTAYELAKADHFTHAIKNALENR